MDPLVILFGFLVGVLVGLTGVGGGALMTPILILVFGFKPVTAIGTDLAYGAVTRRWAAGATSATARSTRACPPGWRWDRCRRRSPGSTPCTRRRRPAASRSNRL